MKGDFRTGALARFAAAGWQVEVVSSCLAKVSPTPRSVLLGAGIDGMPVEDTVQEICVLSARSSGGKMQVDMVRPAPYLR